MCGGERRSAFPAGSLISSLSLTLARAAFSLGPVADERQTIHSSQVVSEFRGRRKKWEGSETAREDGG